MKNVTVTARFPDGEVAVREYAPENGVLTVRARDFEKSPETVEIVSPEFTAHAGDAGYFIVPNTSAGVDNQHAAQIFFRERDDTRTAFQASTMPIYIACDGKRSILAICEGMAHEYFLVAEARGGAYRLFPRFMLKEVGLYEDIVIRFIEIESADWCAVARRYRDYQLSRGACLPLRERVKTNDVLKDAVGGFEIRCRLSYKAVTRGVDTEQTVETEPPLNVNVTFERMEKVVEALHEAGLKKAHFCLVGWGCGGMDGRDPDYFPPDERLGGDAALRRLIEKTKSLGYLVGAHTNPMLAFTISKKLDRNDLLLGADGNVRKWGQCSGGIAYILCDKQSYEHYVKPTQKKLAEYGFRGFSYYDTFTIFKPQTCFSPDHPMTKREMIEYRKKIFECGREAFGCTGSEGAFDYCIGAFDYALYPVITNPPKLQPICDNSVPLWFLVYHGILLYNAFAKTVNASLKGPDVELLSVEYGASPMAYLHARTFEYEGEPNFTCTTDEELKENAKKLADAYRRFEKIADLQYEFFDEYKILEDGVVFTKYSNGTVVIINYNDGEYVYEGKTVPAKSFLRIDA